MSLFWKAAAAVLLAVVLGLSLGKQKDIGVLLTMGGVLHGCHDRHFLSGAGTGLPA